MVAANTIFQNIHNAIGSYNPENDVLLTGRLGLCIYYFSVYQSLGNSLDADMAVSHLETVFTKWNNGSTQLRGNPYSYGSAGLGYVASLLQKAGLVEIDLSTEFKELDTYLFQSALDQVTNDGDIDPLHGAMGVLHYFNSRGDEAYIREHIDSLVCAMAVRVVENPNGIWIKNSSYEKKQQINFSLSHGLCGYLIILLDTYKLGICKDIIEKWVARGIRLLLHYQRQPNFTAGEYQQFATLILLEEGEVPIYSSRLAWCYGDLNVIGLLYKAGEILNNTKWLQLADNCGTTTTKRLTTETTAITDSHFCHGTAGVVACYNSLYQQTGLAVYKQASEYWIAKTVDYVSEEILKGFYTGKETNLLEGLPGVNLALLSATSYNQNYWPTSLFL